MSHAPRSAAPCPAWALEPCYPSGVNRGIFLALFLAPLALFGCDDGEELDAGMDGDTDAGGFDAGSDASLDDAGPFDAGPPAAGALLAEGVCPHDGAVAVTSDGARVAYVTCSGDRAVWTVVLPNDTPVRIDDAADDATVTFSPDDAWVLYDTPTQTRVRDVGATRAAQTVSAPRADEARFYQHTSSQIRVLALVSDGGTRRVDLLTDADLFASSTTLIADPGIVGDLSLVSGSRDTLLVAVDDGGTAYRRVPLDGVTAIDVLPIDPATTLFGPVGLGNTHGIAAVGGGLEFVEFATGTGVELAPDGVNPDDPRFDVSIGADRYVFFLRDGDPTRRLRDGTAAAQTLATGAADGLALTGDGSRLVFTSTGRLFTVDFDGSAAVDLGAYADEVEDVAFARDGSELAFVRGGALVVSPPDQTGMSAVRDDALVVSGSAGYSGDGTLVWLRGADLRAGDPPQTLAVGVARWWPVPRDAAVIYRSTDDELRIR